MRIQTVTREDMLRKEAERFLKDREGRSAIGLQPLPRMDRITYGELARDLRLHYETTGTRGLKEADTRFKAFQPFFTGRRAMSIKGALAEEYVQYRLKTGVAPSTINREPTENSPRSFACSDWVMSVTKSASYP
jgi:hypothetical protein